VTARTRRLRALDVREAAATVATPLLAIALAVALGAVAVLIAGENVVAAYAELVRGAIGTPQNVAMTVVRAVPIVVVGLGVGLAFRSGALNLGGEGQMIAGALASAVAALALPEGLPFPAPAVVALVAGALAGAAWILLPSLFDVRLGVPLLITSLLFNYIAALFAAWAVTYPLRDVAAGGVAQTPLLPAEAWLPGVPGTRLHLGVLALVILPLLIRWFMGRTVAGFEFRMVGHNRELADYAGIAGRRRMLQAALVSGAICGLAGALVVQGLNHRYIEGVITSSGWAWSGFTAAILTGASPILTVVAGVFLAGLEVGAAGMARATDVPLQLVDVVQATIILVVAIRLAIHHRVRLALGAGRGAGVGEG
jgi:general nucleoside transport system permease protein